MTRCALLVTLLLLAPWQATRLTAADDRLFVRPWVELEPFVRFESEYPISSEKATGWLLAEIRDLVSAMVYGWTFDWTPGDKARGVEDSFELTPIARIPAGTERLTILASEVADARLWARAQYRMNAAEALRRASWAGAAIDAATGSGSGNVMQGRAEKMTALSNAVKDAVRNHLHTRILNKPRRIKGEVVLWEDPEVGMWSGLYHAVAKVRLRVTEVVPYSIF